MKFEMKEESWIVLALSCQFFGIMVLVTVNSSDGSGSDSFSLLRFAGGIGGIALLHGGLSAFMKAVDARIAKRQAAPALGRGASPVSEA